MVGEPVGTPELVQVNLYRIAQEALTNARRHGGPDAVADVRLRYDDAGVELEVTNTGRPMVAGRAGLGIVGMRERAAASGGTIEAGPRPRGGFLVRARFPLAAGDPRRRRSRQTEATTPGPPPRRGPGGPTSTHQPLEIP